MKTFYGGIFIQKEKLIEAGINYPIKLEYYKIINKDNFFNNHKEKYGIEIIKTEYTKEKVKTEKENINFFTSNEKEVENILTLFKENEVTPIGAIDVLKDLKLKSITDAIYQ